MSSINLAIADSIATITLQEPRTRNAFDINMVREMHRTLDRVQKEGAAVRSVVVAGSGGVFCSGVDLHSVHLDASEARQQEHHELRKFMDPLMLRFSELRQPLVAAVTGAAVGAGMSLALACDIIVVADDGYFWPSFSRVGLVPDAGVTFRLARRIGGGRAVSALLLADKIDAGKALEWGLAYAMTPPSEVLAKAREVAQRLAAGPRSVLAQIRQLSACTFDHSLPQQLRAERSAQERVLAAQECVEGVRAFFEKREPDYSAS
jgi:2-(1,2-epoxy-1,2-dihydrophenyl)acetyl-CoA isomerase